MIAVVFSMYLLSTQHRLFLMQWMYRKKFPFFSASFLAFRSVSRSFGVSTYSSTALTMVVHTLVVILWDRRIILNRSHRLKEPTSWLGTKLINVLFLWMIALSCRPLGPPQHLSRKHKFRLHQRNHQFRLTNRVSILQTSSGK